MKITKILVVVLLLVARICRIKRVLSMARPDNSTSLLDEILVKIVTSCYGGRIDAVGLLGNVPDNLIRILSDQHLIPVALIDDAKKTFRVIEKVVPPKFHHKLQLFIVEVSSHLQLNMTIQLNIEFTVWRNNMAPFFILDRSPRCSNAEPLLITAWQLNMLNAKVLCHYHEVGTIIFDYNPYTGRAPVSWRLLREYLGVNSHPFKVFYWGYRENEAMCADLNFDKAKDCGGYQISVEGETINMYVPRTSGLGFYETAVARIHARTLDMVYRALKVTPAYTGLYRRNMPTSVDMGVRRNWIINQDTLKTYPYRGTQVVIVTQFRGHKSQLSKIFSVIDVESRFGMGIVYLITLIFLKIVVRQDVVPALLNLVRITCNTGLTNLPDNTAPRIYLTGLLFFVVTMQGIYQGKLASLLTNKVPLKNIDTMDDLLDGDYKIYGREGSHAIIEHPSLKGCFIMTANDETCMANVVHDSSAVCITHAEGVALDLSRKFDLHLSTKSVKYVYYGYQMRRDWPLEAQINIVLGKIVEADIFEPWEVKCNPTNLADFEFDKDVKKNTDFKVIELGEVFFAFIILAVGLVVATVVFVVEVAIYSHSSRIVNVRVQILN